MKKFLTILLITFFALSLSAEIDGPRVGVSTNVDRDPEALKGIGVDENFGAHLNLDLIVTNEAGEKVALRTYFEQGRPVVINMVYYSCGGTCNALLTGSFMVLDELDWKPGEHFEMLNISFEPKENHILAQAKRANYLKQYSL
ncbi:SCO1/SenC family protein, partial [Lentisphaera araneosa HTCC2155]